MSKQSSLIIILALIFISSCDLYPQDDYREYYVVESYLVANRPLPSIRLTRTLPLEEEYFIEKAAVGNADIVVNLLDENNTVERTYTYLNEPGTSKSYYRASSDDNVLPGRRYQLVVTIPDNNETLTSTTLVPGAFETVGTVIDTALYQSEEQITVNTTQSEYPGRQSYFIFSLIAGDPIEDNLTPFYLDQVTEQDEEIEGFKINSSGIINEGNYDINSDGTLTLRVPWLAVAFYGDNDIVANTIDDNLYDFIRSQEVQAGGGPSTLPPGEIQNIIYNIDGGIGIFGSLASDTNRVYIRRNDQFN